MARGALLPLLLALPASAAALVQGGALAVEGQAKQAFLESSWSRVLSGDAGAKKQSPVQRVVALLKKMGTELQAEAASEGESYDKQACWCQTNENEKTRAVADADAADLALTSEIEARAARFGELSTEIEHLKEQIAADKETLKQAVAIREKASSGAYQHQKELVQAINNLENAIAVLAKHHGGSLLQLEKPLVTGMRVLLRDLAVKYELLVAGSAAHRASHRAAFLDVGARAVTLADKATEGINRDLLLALDIHGEEISEFLPLKFAERIVERFAHAAAPSGSFLQAKSQGPAFSSYSSRSTEIYGVLNTMLDEFKVELSRSQSSDTKAAADAVALAAAKEAEITAGKKKLDELEAEHASNTKALADAKENLDATRSQRAADMEFLRNLKLTCNDLATQFDQRKQTRGAELKAVTETISILTEDENRELTARSVALLQLWQNRGLAAADSAAALRRSRAVQALRRASHAPAFEAEDLLAAWRGRRSAVSAVLGAAGGPRTQLSTLAMTVQLDSFSKVKEALDKMVEELKAQQQEEVDFKEYCAKEFSLNQKAAYTKTQEQQDLESKIDQLEALEEKMTKEIDTAKAQIADTQVAIKEASETREKENAEYQSIVADQRATQELLKKALARLQDFYVKGIGSQVLMQRTAQTPPVQFNAYKTNQGSSPVMGLLEQIMEDSSKLEQEAVAGEAQAQATYESFVKDSNAVIKELSYAVVLKTKGVSAAQLEKADAESDRESAVRELGSLAAYEDDLHTQCDFVLKNFDIRQAARLQEIEAIQAAKAILSGST